MPKKINAPSNVKYLFVENVEATPWAPLIEATMVNGCPMEDPEVQKLYKSKHLRLQLLLYKLGDGLITSDY
jgi:hypothetical protein